jgi:ribosome-associated translation inhibitor RaiA
MLKERVEQKIERIKQHFDSRLKTKLIKPWE